MITTKLSEDTPGEIMASSVLQGISGDAVMFYKVLAVLQALSNHKDVLERIHAAFLRKIKIHYFMQNKLTTDNNYR